MEKFNFDGLLQFIKEQETVAATKYGYNFNLLSALPHNHLPRCRPRCRPQCRACSSRCHKSAI